MANVGVITLNEVDTLENLCQFIRRHVDDYYSLELLRFFGAHRYAKFTRLAIIHGVDDDRRSYVERALGQLVSQRVILVYLENGTSFYSLIQDRDSLLGALASNLAKLDWPRWQLVLKNTFLPGWIWRYPCPV